MATELATAYISLSANTKPLANDMKSFFKELDRQASSAGKDVAATLNAEIGKGTPSGAKVLGEKVNRELSASTRGAGTKAMDQFQSESSARGERIGKAVGNVVGKTMGLAISAGIGVAALGATAAIGTLGTALTKGFTRLKKIDEATYKLEALGNSAADVKKIIESASNSVKGTAFGLDEAITGAASAVAAGIKPGADLQSYLSNVADTAAIAGTSFEEMAAIFNKVQTNTKAYTDDLQMLSDRGINVFKYLQNQYGVTADELTKMVQDGKVSSADFQAALSKNLGGAGKIMGQSFTGSVQNAEAALGRLGEALLKPVFGEAAGGVGSVTTALDDLTAWVKNHQADIIGFWTEFGKGAITAAQDGLQAIAELIGAFGGLQDFLGNILGGMNKFQAWQADFRGDHDVADELRAQGEEFFAWGDSAKAAEAKIRSWIDGLESGKGKVEDWGRRAKNAAILTQAFGDSIVAVDGSQIIISDNTSDIDTNLADLGIALQTLPDGRVTLTPNTPEAQALIDAFLAKNNPTSPVQTPVNVDTAKAEGDLRTFAQKWKDFLVAGTPTLPSGPASTSDPLGAPLGIPAPSGEGYITYNPGMNGGRRIPGRASGGPITGPGPKGKDSVLMYGAPGEHMLTDKDVDAMGGQGGVYAFRQALHQGGIPGFERGGPIRPAGVVIDDIAPIGPQDPNAPSRRGKNPKAGNDPSQIGLPDWGTPGQKFGPPPPNWWGKPLDPDDYLFPEWWPPGADWKHPYDERIKGYENGGAINAIDAAYNTAGKPYQYGDFDCSKYMSEIYAAMAGLPAGRYFNTATDFAALGFKRGYKPGALNIGTNGGAGTNGHMAGTLPNGMNVENSSGGGSMYGPGAKGAADFSGQWYYEGPTAEGGAGGTTVHGMGMGAAPGPGVEAAAGGGAGSDLTRTEGYIPSGAGSTSVAGTSMISGFLDMGAQAVGGVIDMAAQAAKMGATAATMGTSAAAGPAAGVGIDILAGMAKRGASYGFEMAGIGFDAAAEIINPFGMPRWAGYDYATFMPNLNISEAFTTTGEKADQAALSNGVDPNTTEHGTANPGGPVSPSTMPGMASGVGTGPAPGPAQSPDGQKNPWNIFGFDQGGMLEPGMIGANFSNKPEPVFTGDQWSDMEAYANGEPVRETPLIGEAYVADYDELGRTISKARGLEAMQYQGRP